MSIAENIAARESAEAVISLIGEESPRFWQELARLAKAQLPAEPLPSDPLPAMGEQEAIRFEKATLPWGAHHGEEIGTVEPGYLLFIAEGDDFTKKLRRYVKSKTFSDRQ
jgi:hypothetical protein